MDRVDFIDMVVAIAEDSAFDGFNEVGAEIGATKLFDKLESDLAELQMRREVEVMADKLDVQIEYYSEKLYYNHLDEDIPLDYDEVSDGAIGPFTLPDLHTKLKEMSE